MIDSSTAISPSRPLARSGRIVGIGASAGGLESLELLFDALPADTGMAFVVIQHLSPDFRSLMDELIARHSEMPVVVARDSVAVEPNRIYLMPPRKEMIIRDRRLVLADKEPHTFSLPIDTFFRSLAQDVGEQAVALVLSGSGSDGSRGILDVKQAGGLVLAEAPTTAKFDGMPLAAAATGAVDHVHAPADLARLLQGLPPLDAQAEPDTLSDDPAMDAVFHLLRDHFGIDFSLYKMATIGRRVQRRVDLARAVNLREYVDQLREDPGELDALYQDLLIGVTQFFRDPEAFELLEREVIPELIDRVPRDEELRVWVAGCGTGEEAYTVAMLLVEQLTARQRPIRLKLLATDVHQASLEFASAGCYGDAQLQYVSPERLQRFFTRRSSGYQVAQELRQAIVFAHHNVIKDAPFTKLHLISCRNMLIYFQPPAQRTVLSLFHFGLVPGGVLLLGASETPGALSDEFVALDERWKIYRKRRDVHLLSQVRLPVHRSQPRAGAGAGVALPRGYGPDPAILATYDQLLDRFMPPGFLIDEQRTLIDSFAGAEQLLRLRARRPSSNLLDLLDAELRVVVASAIQRALRDQAPVSYLEVPIVHDGAPRRCTLVAEPLFNQRTAARHVVVTFRNITEVAALPAAPAAQPDPHAVAIAAASRDRMDGLEHELLYTRETLQATIEELETSAEEMQATNEELVASNEELQSTNEELHSVNEELYTVNAEYQHKIAELRELNADMAHLIEGTGVGTVFLDRELRIRRFTSRIAKVFRLQPHDIGRQLTDFSHNIERPALLDEIQSARDTGQVVEDEVRDRCGTPYFLRILPYRVGSNGNGVSGNGVSGNGVSGNGVSGNGGHGAAHGAPIEGVVLTLNDISALDKARARLAQLSAIVESSDDAIVGKSLDGTITSWNRGAELLYGYTADEALGRKVSMLMQPGSEAELATFVERIKRGERIEHVQSLRVRKDGTPIDVSITISPIHDDTTLIGVSGIARDITPLVAAQRTLEERQREVNRLLALSEDAARRREQFLAMLSHELRNPLAAVMHASTVLARSPDPEASRRCRAAIDRQTQHMKRLLDDLLDVSRITRGKFELRVDDVDLRAPIEAAIESTAPLLADRGVRLVHRLPAAALPVRGDASRLMQVVVNLLSNAANYSPQHTEVELSAELDDGRAVVRVTDHGVGIEPELHDKIFELFVQSDQRLDRSRGGLGVGLSLARSIVELHGGAIAVRSEGTGKGSAFSFAIPLATGVTARGDQAAPRRAARRRIVLVDDQDDSREMLRMLLEARNHVVHDAADGPAAIELIEREKPDVAFIDIGLPAMNGYEVAQRIRARAELAGVRLVALTGYGAPTDVTAAREAGFDEHLIKPAELARIEQILACERRSAG